MAASPGAASSAAPSRRMKPPPTESQVSSARHDAVLVARDEAERVGMARRRVDDVEDDRPLRVEADRPPPAKRQAVRSADARRQARRRHSRSMVSGSRPQRPRTTARSVAWPRPVKASEPNSVTSTLATRAIAPDSASPAAKAAAAFIGPTVCEDDGPTPILNRSKTLIMAGPREGHVRRRAASAKAALRDKFQAPCGAPPPPAFSRSPSPVSLTLHGGEERRGVFPPLRVSAGEGDHP